MRRFSTLLLLPIFAMGVSSTQAAPPPLREQISLNGTWGQGGKVPQYNGVRAMQKTYARRVEVPASWAGKVVKLHFEAVNFAAEISVDGQPAGRHVGGWVPFDIDVTRLVQPGQSFALEVAVTGRNSPPIVDAKGKPLWPIGSLWDKQKGESSGIVDDVFLRAYGQVHIDDAFVQTSVRDRRLTVNYTLVNSDSQAREVKLTGEAAPSNFQGAKFNFSGPAVTLAPGETKTVRLTAPWPDAALWWPDAPNLYHLRSRLTAGGATVDEETRRFGFREIGIEGAQFRLNGVRLNLVADYAIYGKATHWPVEGYTPAGWPKLVDTFKNLNIRMIRWHKRPAPRYTLDVADEKGLFILAESAIGGGHGGGTGQIDHERFIANSRQWVSEWVRGSRHHPSLLMWSAMNEMGNFTAPQARAVGEVMRELDPTRPIVYEGSSNPGYKGDPNQQVTSRHYPRPFGNKAGVWTGSGPPWGEQYGIYAWSVFVDPKRPTVAGEMLYVPGSAKPNAAQQRNMWWQGVWTRGMRYTDWAEIGPAIYRWVRDEPPDSLKVQNLRNAFAPVALFDKAYDELGIAPFTSNALPVLQAGQTATRTLVLYNDEFRDPNVTVEVAVRAGGKTVASGSRAYAVTLGSHVDLPCSFVVSSGAAEMELVLTTRKGKVEKFRETRRFKVEGNSGGRSNSVTLGAASASVMPKIKVDLDAPGETTAGADLPD